MAYLDTRDLAKRLEELKDEKENLISLIEEAEESVEEIEEEIAELDENEGLEMTLALAFDMDENEGLEMTLALAVDMVENAKTELEEWIEENQEEIEELEGLENEISEWSDGNTMIPEEDFVSYCQELLEDIGDIPKDLPHYIVINWESTADNLKADYSEVEYQGNTYLVRD